MDIGTILKGVGIAKDFLGGGDSNQNGEKGPSLLDIYADVKSRNYTVKAGYGGQEKMAPPGQAQAIQQVDYNSTQQFWDNLLKDYMRG